MNDHSVSESITETKSACASQTKRVAIHFAYQLKLYCLVMTSSTFWKPVILSLIAAPICLFIGMLSAGGGHSSYLLAKFLFPYTMVSIVFFKSITIPFIVLAIIEIPFYGLVLGVANAKNKFLPFAVVILLAHILAVAACFLFIDKSFV